MCGFLFYKGKEGEDLSQNEFEAALSIQSERGPDATKIVVIPGQNTMIGHTRLALISDTSGLQPFCGEGYNVVFVGEIYNYKEISRNLFPREHIASESQLLLKLICKYGKAGFQYLDGMFAIAIYHRATGKLILHRDEFGIKPIFFSLNSRRAIVSADSRSIKYFLKSASINKRAVHSYLLYRAIPGDQTIFNDIRKVQPGEIVEIDTEHNKIIDSGIIRKNECKTVYSSDAVREAVIKDVKSTFLHIENNRVSSQAILLSSGIDSNIICSIVSEYKPLTLTASFIGQQPEKSEHRLAERAASLYGTEHITVACNPSLDLFDRILRISDGPLYSSSSFGLLCMANAIKELGIRTVYCGDGADELFYGYSQLCDSSNMHEYQRRVGIADLAIISALVEDVHKDYFHQLLEDDFRKIQFSEDPFKDFELYIRLPEYQAVRLDRIFMDYSIEARVPFLRKSTSQIANSISKRDHVSQGRKSILRQAFKNDLYDFIYSREKQRFKAPISSWIPSDFKFHINRALNDSEAISMLGLSHLKIKQVLSGGSYRLIWGLYTLIRWVELEYGLEPQQKIIVGDCEP